MAITKIFAYDLETTGTIHLLHGIHQLAGKIIIDGKVKETFDFRIFPGFDVEYDKEALEKWGVTKKIVTGYPNKVKVIPKIIALLDTYVNCTDPKDKFFKLGYSNTHFDDDFLFDLLGKQSWKYFWSGGLDVMVLAAEYLKFERHKMRDFKLHTVAGYLGIKVNEKKLHEAGYDIDLTWQIYLKITTNETNKRFN